MWASTGMLTSSLPSDRAAGNCIHAIFSGQLNNSACTNLLPFICEYRSKYVKIHHVVCQRQICALNKNTC